MKIFRNHFIQELDGLSHDDVTITGVDFHRNSIRIRWVDYDDNGNILECEHIITDIDNKPSEQKDIIIITGLNREP